VKFSAGNPSSRRFPKVTDQNPKLMSRERLSKNSSTCQNSNARMHTRKLDATSRQVGFSIVKDKKVNAFDDSRWPLKCLNPVFLA